MDATRDAPPVHNLDADEVASAIKAASINNVVQFSLGDPATDSARSLDFDRVRVSGGVFEPAEVQVYRNLHFRDRVVWSVRDAATRLVVGHVAEIVLDDAAFVVQPGGLRRAREVKQRNVHAWVLGTVTEARRSGVWLPATYNPWCFDSFVYTEDGSLVVLSRASQAALTEGGLEVLAPAR